MAATRAQLRQLSVFSSRGGSLFNLAAWRAARKQAAARHAEESLRVRLGSLPVRSVQVPRRRAASPRSATHLGLLRPEMDVRSDDFV